MLLSTAPLMLAVALASEAPSMLTAAQLATLLERHVCSMGPHPPIDAAGFLPGLEHHLWDLPATARSDALSYLAQHQVPGFAAGLVDRVAKAGLQDQANIAHALPRLPDVPSPAALVQAAGAVEDPTVRALFVRVLVTSNDRPAALVALRGLRPRERDPHCSLVMDLVGAWLGGDEEFRRADKSLAAIPLEDVLSTMDVVVALAPAPALAPLFRSWLDDKRVVGMLSHRNTVPYRVRDFGARAIHTLGVPLAPPITHVDHAEDALIARMKKALSGNASRGQR